MRSLARLLLLLLTAGCAHALQDPFTSPAKGGPPWTEVTTPHFVLTTDHDRTTALRAAADLERMFALVSEFCFESKQMPRMKVEVVYFRRDAEMDLVLKGRGISSRNGIFLSNRRYDFERQTMAVVSGDLVKGSGTTLQHELTHFFIDFYYPQAPTWLHEGMAEYCAELEQEDGMAILGRLPRHGLFRDGPGGYACPRSGCAWFIPESEAASVQDLIAMSWDDFHCDQTVDDYSPEGVEARRRESAHYASAYYLIRLLVEDTSYHPPFAAFLARVRDGEAAEAAWAGSMGRLPREKLEADYHASMRTAVVFHRRTKFQAPAIPAPQVRTLWEGEVRAYWARLWSWDDSDGLAKAGGELAQIPRKEAASTDSVLLRSRWKLTEGNERAALDLLDEGLRDHPGEPRLVAARGWVLLRGNGSTEDLAAIEKALAPRAETAGQLDLLGRINLRARKLAASFAYEKRALALDPSCIGCLSTVAKAQAAEGHTAAALATARHAQGLLHHGVRSPTITDQIAEYQATLEGRPPPAAAVSAPAETAGNDACADPVPAPTQPKGRLPAAVLRKVLMDNQPALARCYDAGRARNPTLAGKVIIRFSIAPDGTVRDVRAACPTLPDTQVIACVVAAYRKLVFPRPEGGAVPMSTPVVFAP